MIQNDVTLIAAIAAALCSIIAAWRGQKTETKLTALAAAVAPRPPVFVPVPAPAPSGADPAFSFGDILKYYGIFSEMSAFFDTLHGLPVGQVAMTPLLKTKVNGRHGELGPTPFVFKD